MLQRRLRIVICDPYLAWLSSLWSSCPRDREDDLGSNGDHCQARSRPKTAWNYSTAKTFGASEISYTVNGSVFLPVMPGEPSGIPGSEIPLILGCSLRSLFIALTGT